MSVCCLKSYNSTLQNAVISGLWYALYKKVVNVSSHSSTFMLLLPKGRWDLFLLSWKLSWHVTYFKCKGKDVGMGSYETSGSKP